MFTQRIAKSSLELTQSHDQSAFDNLKNFILKTKYNSFPDIKTINSLSSQPDALEKLAQLINKPLEKYLLQYGKNNTHVKLLLVPADVREDFGKKVRVLLRNIQSNLNIQLRAALAVDHNKLDLNKIADLILKGADIHFQYDRDMTLFDFAFKRHHVDVVNFFMDADMDVNPLMDHAFHLFLAIEYGRDDLVKMILDSKKIDVNVRNHRGDTPLIQACYLENLACIQHIVNAGADVSLKNAEGKTPQDILEITKHRSVNEQKDLMSCTVYDSEYDKEVDEKLLSSINAHYDAMLSVLASSRQYMKETTIPAVKK
jgi:ankyrin repeat protein